jgi:hypothetical protein
LTLWSQLLKNWQREQDMQTTAKDMQTTTKVRILFLYDFHMFDNSSTKGLLDVFTHLRNHFWGENRFERRTAAGKSYLTLDLTHANVALLNRRSISILFIRDEYGLAYNNIVQEILESAGEVRSVFLITGQPGIGQ